MISCNAACLSLAILDVSIRALASHRALRPPPSVTSQRPQPHFSHLTTTIGQLSAPMSPRPSRRLTWYHRARDHQQPAAVPGTERGQISAGAPECTSHFLHALSPPRTCLSRSLSHANNTAGTRNRDESGGSPAICLEQGRDNSCLFPSQRHFCIDATRQRVDLTSSD